MKKQGINNENVKISNRATVLQLLLSSGPISRSDIATELNLTPATVTIICNEFLKQNLLTQDKEFTAPAKVGRKKLPIELNANCKFVLSINIQTDETGIFICNLKADCIAYKYFPSDACLSPEEFLKRVAAESIKLLWDQQLALNDLLGVGVTILGPVNHIDGISLNAFSLWKKPVEVKKILERELCLPVTVESNVCAFLAGELLFSSVEYQNVLAIKWGPGVGSASAINHHLFKGTNFNSSEVGHNLVDRAGKKCRCGRKGCLETKISEDAIVEKIEQILKENPSEELSENVETYGAPCHKNIQKFLATNDKVLQNYLDEIAYQLAVVVNNAMQIMVPDKVIVFGNLFENQIMFDKFKNLFFSINDIILENTIIRSQYIEKEDYIGAVAIAVKKFLVDVGGNIANNTEKSK